jgi:hypothetical protein
MQQDVTDAKYSDSGWWCWVTITLTRYFLIEEWPEKENSGDIWRFQSSGMWCCVIGQVVLMTASRHKNLNLQLNCSENLESHTVVKCCSSNVLPLYHHKSCMLLPSTILFHISNICTTQDNITKQKICQYHLNTPLLYSQPYILSWHSHWTGRTVPVSSKFSLVLVAYVTVV